MGIIAAIRHRTEPGTATAQRTSGTESEPEPVVRIGSRLRWVHVERDGQPINGYPHRPELTSGDES